MGENPIAGIRYLCIEAPTFPPILQITPTGAYAITEYQISLDTRYAYDAYKKLCERRLNYMVPWPRGGGSGGH
jgi:hypothetical protein